MSRSLFKCNWCHFFKAQFSWLTCPLSGESYSSTAKNIQYIPLKYSKATLSVTDETGKLSPCAWTNWLLFPDYFIICNESRLAASLCAKQHLHKNILINLTHFILSFNPNTNTFPFFKYIFLNIQEAFMLNFLHWIDPTQLKQTYSKTKKKSILIQNKTCTTLQTDTYEHLKSSNIGNIMQTIKLNRVVYNFVSVVHPSTGVCLFWQLVWKRRSVLSGCVLNFSCTRTFLLSFWLADCCRCCTAQEKGREKRLLPSNQVAMDTARAPS